jgi:hypothetical protein
MQVFTHVVLAKEPSSALHLVNEIALAVVLSVKRVATDLAVSISQAGCSLASNPASESLMSLSGEASPVHYTASAQADIMT